MQKLVAGIHQFQQQIRSERPDLLNRMSKGQEPLALFITCSDSRINPNLITQTEPGELFILRNAGNIIPPYGAVHGGEEFRVAAPAGDVFERRDHRIRFARGATKHRLGIQ